MSRNINKVNEITIIGGSLFGVLLAIAIRKEIRDQQIKITIHEKGDEILKSWDKQNVMGVDITNGFHGIEMPRAKNFEEILEKQFINKNFRKIDNYKLIWMSNKLIPYKYDENELTQEMEDELHNIETIEQIKNYLEEKNKGIFGELIEKVSRRYGDDIESSFHMIFPWYFPKRYFTNRTDLSSQSHKKEESYYLVPQEGTFEKIRNELKKYLNKLDIMVKIRSDVNIELEKKGEIVIWATNTTILARRYLKNDTENLLVNKRNLEISLLKAEKDKIKEKFYNMPYFPSEIMIIEEENIDISRISFMNDTENDKYIYILVESQSAEAIKIDPTKLNLITERILDIKVTYIGSKKIGVIHNGGMKNYEKLDLMFDEVVKKLNVRIGFKYWWPINSCRAADAAMQYSKEIIKEIKERSEGYA